jgi:hypothetical protein
VGEGIARRAGAGAQAAGEAPLRRHVRSPPSGAPRCPVETGSGRTDPAQGCGMRGPPSVHVRAFGEGGGRPTRGRRRARAAGGRGWGGGPPCFSGPRWQGAGRGSCTQFPHGFSMERRMWSHVRRDRRTSEGDGISHVHEASVESRFHPFGPTEGDTRFTMDFMGRILSVEGVLGYEKVHKWEGEVSKGKARGGEHLRAPGPTLPRPSRRAGGAVSAFVRLSPSFLFPHSRARRARLPTAVDGATLAKKRRKERDWGAKRSAYAARPATGAAGDGRPTPPCDTLVGLKPPIGHRGPWK